MALLQGHDDRAAARFLARYERAVAAHLAVLDRRRRVPDNHYCVDVAPLPLESPIHAALKAGGPNRATPEQWRASLLALAGVLACLAQRGDDARPRPSPT